MHVNQISVQDGFQANMWSLNYVKVLKHELFKKLCLYYERQCFFTFSWWMNLWVEFAPCKKCFTDRHVMSSEMLSMELALYWTCYIPLKQHNKLDTVSLRKFKVSGVNLFLLIQQFPLIIWLRGIIYWRSENNCVYFRSCRMNHRCNSGLI